MRRTLVSIIILSCLSGFSYAQNPRPGVPIQGSEIAKWREDLRYMAEEMPKLHDNLFHSMSREQFEAAVRQLDEKIPRLARHQIIIEMARIVAKVGETHDGHTSLPLVPPPHPGAPFKVGFRQYPIKLDLYSDGFYVQSATPEFARLVGARVLKIGSVGAELAFKTASEIVSRDNEMTLKSRVPPLLSIPEVLHALGLIENMEKAPFTLEIKGVETVVEFSPMAAGQDVKWRDAREASTNLPLRLKDPLNNYWFEYLADSRTVYFQYNLVVNKRGHETIDNFFHKLFAFIQDQPVDRFIIDMRQNAGGNAVFNWPLVYGIIRSDKVNQKGKLFTIIGRYTYSAGSQTAAWLGKHTNTIFVGEPSGGGVNVYGDHTSIVLPNSQIQVWVAPHYFQNTYPWDKRLWITPQITAELSYDDERRNNDPALTAILNYQSIGEILTKALAEGGLELVIKRYREFRNNPKTAAINTEGEINALGYQLMEHNRISEAIEVFKLNVESYPKSPNAFDSLGDAYLKRGDKELAIKSYQRSLELNPGSDHTRQKLNSIQ